LLSSSLQKPSNLIISGLSKTVTKIPQPRKGPNGILVFRPIFFIKSGTITKMIPLNDAIIIATILPIGPRKKPDTPNNLTSPNPIPFFESFLTKNKIENVMIDVMRLTSREPFIREYMIPDTNIKITLVSGIIMNSRSTKVNRIIENARAENVRASIVEFENEKLRRKHKPVSNSTIGYLIGIFQPHTLHFPLKRM